MDTKTISPVEDDVIIQKLKRRGYSDEKIQLYYEAYCMFPKHNGLITAESLHMFYSSIGVNETKSNDSNNDNNNSNDNSICGSINEYNDIIQLFLGTQDEKSYGIDFENFVMGIENFIDRNEGSAHDTVFALLGQSQTKSDRLLYILEKQHVNETYEDDGSSSNEEKGR